MSRTLNLADRVFATGRSLQELGRDEDALRMLGRLASWQELPTQVAEETQNCLAEIRMRHGQFAQARRHVAALLVHRPDNARYHYLLAATLDADQKESAEAACAHYRRALAIDPNQADCLSDFGLLALRLGNEEEGLQALHRAVELAPDDSLVVAKLAEGLHRCGKHEEARQTLLVALFRNSRNPAFHRLWNDFRFRQVCAAQQATGRTNRALANTDELVSLPLEGLADSAAQGASERKRVRADRVSSFSPPHLRGPSRAPGEKRA